MKPSIGPGGATRVTDSGAVSRVKVFFHLTTDKFIYLNPKLYVLAFLELRQNDDMRNKAGFLRSPRLIARNFVHDALGKVRLGFLLLWLRLR